MATFGVLGGLIAWKIDRSKFLPLEQKFVAFQGQNSSWLLQSGEIDLGWCGNHVGRPISLCNLSLDGAVGSNSNGRSARLPSRDVAQSCLSHLRLAAKLAEDEGATTETSKICGGSVEKSSNGPVFCRAFHPNLCSFTIISKRFSHETPFHFPDFALSQLFRNQPSFEVS